VPDWIALRRGCGAKRQTGERPRPERRRGRRSRIHHRPVGMIACSGWFRLGARADYNIVPAAPDRWSFDGARNAEGRGNRSAQAGGFPVRPPGPRLATRVLAQREPLSRVRRCSIGGIGLPLDGLIGQSESGRSGVWRRTGPSDLLRHFRKRCFEAGPQDGPVQRERFDLSDKFVAARAGKIS